MINQIKKKSNVVILGYFFHKAKMFQCISKVNFLYIIWQIWLSWSICCFEIRNTQKPHILYIWLKFPIIDKQFFPFFLYQTNKRIKLFLLTSQSSFGIFFLSESRIWRKKGFGKMQMPKYIFPKVQWLKTLFFLN